jgi:hypothetical protein
MPPRQQAQVALDQVTFGRYAALLKVNSIAKAQYDTAKFTLATAQNTLSSLQDQAEVQLAKLGGNLNTPVEQMPAISGSAFAGERAAAPARPHRRARAVRRHRHRSRFASAGHARDLGAVVVFDHQRGRSRVHRRMCGSKPT